MHQLVRPVVAAAVLGLLASGTPVAVATPSDAPGARSPRPRIVPKADAWPTRPRGVPTPSRSAGSPPPPAASSAAGFPDASSTGARGTLSAYSGAKVISIDGAVIDAKRITGQLTVDADNVTVRNSRITSTATYGILVWGKNFTLADSTLDGTAGQASIAGFADQGGGDIHLIRVDGSGSPDLVRMGADGSSVVDSYLHDVCGPARCSGAHNDTVGVLPGTRNVRINHNTILNAENQTAAVEIGDTRSAQSSGELRHNLLAGGGYSVYAMGASHGLGWTVDGNAFSTRYYGRGGYWGPVTSWSAGTGNVWTNNRWLETGQPVGP